MGKQWYKPSEIAELGLIKNTKGLSDYGYVVRLIRKGKLSAKNVGLGKTPYSLVNIKEINRFNEQGVMTMDNKPEVEERPVVTFRKELTDLINKHSLEQYCNTPDFIIADHLVNCFNLYCNTKNDTEAWFTPATKPKGDK